MARSVVFLLFTITSVLVDNISVLGVTFKSEASSFDPPSDLVTSEGRLTSKCLEKAYAAIEDGDVENFKKGNWLRFFTNAELSQIHQKVMEKGEKALNIRRYLFENYSHYYTMSMLREEAINILQISDAEVRKENLKLFRDSQRVSGIDWGVTALYSFLETAIERGGSGMLEEMKELLFPRISLHRIPLVFHWNANPSLLYIYRRFLIKAASVNNTVYKEICVWLQQKMPLRFTIPRNHPFSIERYNNLLNRMEVGSDEWLREASEILVPLDSELSPNFDKTPKTFRTLFATIRTLLDVPEDVLLRIRDFVGE